MFLTSSKCRFLCKETRQSKKNPNKNYYLYTVMADGKILPSFYSKEDINVDGVQDCTLELETSVFDGRLNLNLKGIAKDGK